MAWGPFTSTQLVSLWDRLCSKPVSLWIPSIEIFVSNREYLYVLCKILSKNVLSVFLMERSRERQHKNDKATTAVSEHSGIGISGLYVCVSTLGERSPCAALVVIDKTYSWAWTSSGGAISRNHCKLRDWYIISVRSTIRSDSSDGINWQHFLAETNQKRLAKVRVSFAGTHLTSSLYGKS